MGVVACLKALTRSRGMASGPTFSPARRILLENLPMWYLFGNTKGRSFVDVEALGGKDTSVLLLGCGDIRNVLCTAAANSRHLGGGRSLTSARGGKNPPTPQKVPQQRLSFHMNDINAVVVARAALLLSMSRELDASRSEDVDFLWATWYDMAVTRAHRERMQKAAAKLAAQMRSGGRAGFVNVPREEDRAQLEKIFTSWLPVSDWPSAASMASLRESHMRRHGFRKAREAEELTGDADNIDSFEKFLTASVFGVEQLAHPDGSIRKTEPHLEKSLTEEAKAWLKTGVTGLRPGEISTLDSLVVNPTMVDPETHAWHLHYGSLPFCGYLPFQKPYGIVPPGKKGRPSPFLLTDACKKVLRDYLAGFCAWFSGGGGEVGGCPPPLEVHLWCGDALKLCLYDLPSKFDGARFDAIDTSNLSDNLGLLNVLLCGGPLLKSRESARLHTGTLLWPTASLVLRDYVLRSLNFSLRLSPALLSLRLLTDFDLEPSGSTPMVLRSMGCNLPVVYERVLEWAPANVGARPTKISVKFGSGESGGKACGVADALRAVHEVACLSDFAPLEGEKCGLRTATALTGVLAARRALADVSRPGDGVELAGELLWGGRGAGKEEKEEEEERGSMFVKGWEGLWHLTGGGQTNEDGRVLNAGELAERVKSLSCYNTMLGRDTSDAHAYTQAVGSTPLLRLFLVENMTRVPPALHLILGAAMEPHSSVSKNGIHVIDNFEYDHATGSLCFALAADHGMSPATTLVVLASACRDMPPICHPTFLARFTCRQVAPPHLALPPPHHGEEGVTTSTSVEGVLSVSELCEFEDCYKALLKFPSGTQGGVAVEAADGDGTDDHVLAVRVRLGKGPRGECVLRFGWPVAVNTAGVQVSRSKGTLTCRFPKVASWHAVGGGWGAWSRGKMDLDSLPEWPATELDRLSSFMSNMFSLQEIVWKEHSQRKEFRDKAAKLSFDARESLQVFFVRHLKEGYRIFPIVTKEGSEQDISVVTGPMREAPDGHPMLEVIWFDHVRSKKLVAAGKFDINRGFKAYQQIFEKCMGPRKVGCSILCSPGEVSIFRSLLQDNQVLLASPSKWQKKWMVGAGWNASVLLPLYSTDVYFGGRTKANESRAHSSSALAADPFELAKMLSQSRLQKDGEGSAKGGGRKQPRTSPPKSGAAKAGSSNGSTGGGEEEGSAGLPGNAESGTGTNGTEEQKVCSGCGSEVRLGAKLRRCSRCRTSKYCDQDCQRRHWPTHRSSCQV